MSYIAPNTTLHLLQDIPIDNTYVNTLYFDSSSAQVNYFLSHVAHTYSNLSYQRVNKNTIRVQVNAEGIVDCSYMMFQNSNYGTHWFFAFVISVDYINNACCEITYEIDVMQTWYFAYNFRQCYVERMHTATDSIGDHIEPEGLPTGEYVMNDYAPILTMRDMCVIIAIVDTDEVTDGTLYDGIYGSADLWVYNSTDVTSINSKINEYVQQTDAIIGIYMCPKALIGESLPDTNKLSYGASAYTHTVTLEKIAKPDTLDGYTPKNCKMYTYPYSFLHVDNASGSSLELRYEFFDNRIPVFEIGGTITQPVVCILRPCSYKGVASYSELGGYTTYNAETLQLNNYPICSWNVDSYQAWVAQNSVPLVLNSAASLGETAIAANYSTNPAAMVGSSVLGKVSSIASQWYQASIASDMSKGNLNNGGGNVSTGKQMFYAGRASVTAEYAKMIDDYFTMFGYAIKRVTTPSRHNREHWTFIKTVGCNIIGNMPGDAIRKVCEIYDRGITFWVSGDEVGNYALDNGVLT